MVERVSLVFGTGYYNALFVTGSGSNGEKASPGEKTAQNAHGLLVVLATDNGEQQEGNHLTCGPRAYQADTLA